MTDKQKRADTNLRIARAIFKRDDTDGNLYKLQVAEKRQVQAYEKEKINGR